MQQILNTLYVMTQGAYLHLDHETLKVEVEGKTQLQVPIHHLGAVVCFGNIMVSPAAMARCAEDGRDLVFMDSSGRFKAKLIGPTSGNVLLRQAQHKALGTEEKTLAIARNIVAAKIQNARNSVMRSAREADNAAEGEAFRKAGETLAQIIAELANAKDLDAVRGHEGLAAATYFETFGKMVRQNREFFRFDGRNRRPPRDPVNALLSFLYALLLNDCVAGAEGVGLDPQIGYLHGIRPGRPSLGLDLMEELRPVLADRLALSLINRQQIGSDSFIERPGGAVHLNDEGRKAVVVAYQKRKTDEVYHQAIDQKIALGLVPHVQARLLARYLRGDMEEYMPFIYR